MYLRFFAARLAGPWLGARKCQLKRPLPWSWCRRRGLLADRCDRSFSWVGSDMAGRRLDGVVRTVSGTCTKCWSHALRSWLLRSQRVTRDGEAKVGCASRLHSSVPGRTPPAWEMVITVDLGWGRGKVTEHDHDRSWRRGYD
jgi:hypothetical protein